MTKWLTWLNVVNLLHVLVIIENMVKILLYRTDRDERFKTIDVIKLIN